jgi:hypothetical protein
MPALVGLPVSACGACHPCSSHHQNSPRLTLVSKPALPPNSFSFGYGIAASCVVESGAGQSRRSQRYLMAINSPRDSDRACAAYDECASSRSGGGPLHDRFTSEAYEWSTSVVTLINQTASGG